MRTPFAAIFLMSWIFPSQLTIFSTEPTTWNVSEDISIGEMVVVNSTSTFDRLYLSGRPMVLAQKAVYFGVAPEINFAITSLRRISTSWASGWLYPQQMLFSQTVRSVKSPSLQAAAKLQIPKTVWQKLNNGQEEQRRLDHLKLVNVLNQKYTPMSFLAWQPPVRSKITSRFASPRSLPNGRVYLHSGEDRRAPVGTNIVAAATGIVAFAGDMVVPGRNIVLAHGNGLFTRYLHLNEIYVQEGQQVKAGDRIAASGATGRVEAPHLHWEILWRGIPADPDHFLPTLARLFDPGSNEFSMPTHNQQNRSPSEVKPLSHNSNPEGEQDF